jgi:antitoxin YefM
VIILKFFNFSDDRSGLKGVINQVIADYTVISRRHAPDAILMSFDTFNSLLETLHLLKSPAKLAHPARYIEQGRMGQIKTLELFDFGQ